MIGANALAFPGGPIVLTDDLIKLLENDNLILGVIAHEFVHIQKQHSLKQIIEIIGIAALSSIILGSNETLIEEASFVGINLWASKKSREFEKEADLLDLAVQKVLDNGLRTRDIMSSGKKEVTTSSMGDAIIFDGNTVHCGAVNSEANDRFSVEIRLYETGWVEKAYNSQMR